MKADVVKWNGSNGRKKFFLNVRLPLAIVEVVVIYLAIETELWKEVNLFPEQAPLLLIPERIDDLLIQSLAFTA